MSIALTDNVTGALATVAVNRRMILFHGEVACLHAPCQIRVLSGDAWVSFNGHDILLASGEQHDFLSSHDCAVVSPMGKSALILQIID